MHISRLIPVFCMLLAGSVFASEVSLAPIIYRFDYTEFDDDGSTLNNEAGLIPGIEANLQSGFSKNWYGSGGLRWVRGTVDYDGETQLGLPHQTNTDEEMLRLNAKIGRCFNGCDSPYSLFAGVSRWDWQRDIQPADGVLGPVSGLSENYNWWELEFGGGASYKHSSGGSWDFGLSGLWIHDPTVKVDLNEINFGEPQLDLQSGPGVRARVFWRNPGAASSAFRWGAGVTYERWEFGESDLTPVSGGNGQTILIREPDSLTESIFFEANMIWMFE